MNPNNFLLKNCFILVCSSLGASCAGPAVKTFSFNLQSFAYLYPVAPAGVCNCTSINR